MVQTAQSRMADHRTGGRRTDSAARGFLAEAKMRAVLVIMEMVIRFRSFYGLSGVCLNAGREETCSKPFENGSPIKRHVIQNPML
ncbi:MAG: hypothetical protein DMG70_19510 [Acidobacteria bacterium]|nr:MAG: hypothetical protein DMG70_19510 [Acidobacteriota bacterium]PYY11476.1 MAG: hypothetical protein DMG69_03790 [Acidobacteriota bacterium]